MRAEVFFTILIYLVYFSGLILCQSDNLMILVKRYRLRHRLAVREEKSDFIKSCSAFLSAVTGRDIDGVWLVAAEILLFIVVFILCAGYFILPAAFIMALLSAALPLFILYSQLEKKRSKGSREGISLVSELYREYRMHDLNITEALEAAVASEVHFPICRRQLYLLILKLRDSLSRENVDDACRAFSFALGTVWGKMLGSCIRSAVIEGTDISPALSDIMQQLKTAKLLYEERKRMNGESARMALILVPLIYVGSIFLSHSYLNLSYSQIFRNQFRTGEGLLLFMVSVFLFVLNIMILNLVSSSRVDY